MTQGAYNAIYEKLVADPSDVVGAIAYSLYKSEKAALIAELTAKNGVAPKDSDLDQFRAAANLELRLQAYKSQAESLLEAFLDDVLATELLTQQLKIREDAIVKAVTPKFMSGVGQNLIAGFVSSAITFGLVFAGWVATEGPEKILNKALSKFLPSDAAAQSKDTGTK